MLKKIYAISIFLGALFFSVAPFAFASYGFIPTTITNGVNNFTVQCLNINPISELPEDDRFYIFFPANSTSTDYPANTEFDAGGCANGESFDTTQASPSYPYGDYQWFICNSYIDCSSSIINAETNSYASGILTYTPGGQVAGASITGVSDVSPAMQGMATAIVLLVINAVVTFFSGTLGIIVICSLCVGLLWFFIIHTKAAATSGHFYGRLGKTSNNIYYSSKDGNLKKYNQKTKKTTVVGWPWE